LIGAAVTGRSAGRIGFGPAFVLGAFLFPAPVVLVPLAGGSRLTILTMLFLAEFDSGFGVMMLDVRFGSISQALVPDRLRARVAGGYRLVNNRVRPVGSLLRGALGAWIWAQSTLWIGALGGFFLIWSPAPRLRALPEPAEWAQPVASSRTESSHPQRRPQPDGGQPAGERRPFDRVKSSSPPRRPELKPLGG
jgi:MFS family permease